MQKALHFLKYNNAAALILAAIFLFSAGAFAQTEAGQEIIGQKQTRIEGIDNTLLLAADLDNFNMDFKIEKIAEDGEMYYAAYTFLDIEKNNGAWQYQLNEKTKKISKKSLAGGKDLGVYLAEELGEEYADRLKELKKEQERAREQGEEKRTEITGYSGLIGKSLDLAARVFPGYEPVEKREMPSPEAVEMTHRTNGINGTDRNNPPNPPYEGGRTDNLAEIYSEYINAHLEQIAELGAATGESDAPVGLGATAGEAAADSATTTEEVIATSTPPAIEESAAPEEAADEPKVEIIELPE